jgi:hypothetical protein
MRKPSEKLNEEDVNAAIEAWQRGTPIAQIKQITLGSLYKHLGKRGITPNRKRPRLCAWCQGQIKGWREVFCCDEHKQLSMDDEKAKRIAALIRAGAFERCLGCSEFITDPEKKKFHNRACQRAFVEKQLASRITIVRRDLALGATRSETARTLGVCLSTVILLRKIARSELARDV